MADAILEGTPVDWTAAKLGGSADPSLERQLRVLADLAAVHRTLFVGESPLRRDEPQRRRLASHVGPPATPGEGRPGRLRRSLSRVGSAPQSRGRAEVARTVGPSRGGDSPSWVLEEARFLAAIRHPNVVTVHGADRIDRRVGFWTEFIHGRTLAELVHEQGTFTARGRRCALASTCAARSPRCIAPAFCIATSKRTMSCARTAVASSSWTSARPRTSLSTLWPDAAIGDPNGPTGTPLYVAPELWRNRAATPQSDIYSLGVLLYFLVTGSYPVRGATVRDVGNAHRRNAGLAPRRASRPASRIS